MRLRASGFRDFRYHQPQFLAVLDSSRSDWPGVACPICGAHTVVMLHIRFKPNLMLVISVVLLYIADSIISKSLGWFQVIYHSLATSPRNSNRIFLGTFGCNLFRFPCWLVDWYLVPLSHCGGSSLLAWCCQCFSGERIVVIHRELSRDTLWFSDEICTLKLLLDMMLMKPSFVDCWRARYSFWFYENYSFPFL
jgi:hypothetical protein